MVQSFYNQTHRNKLGSLTLESGDKFKRISKFKAGRRKGVTNPQTKKNNKKKQISLSFFCLIM